MMLDIYLNSGPPALISAEHWRLSGLALNQQAVSAELRPLLKKMMYKLITLQGLTSAEIDVLDKAEISLYRLREEKLA